MKLKMKQVLSVLLALLMTMSIAGCGTASDGSPQGENAEASPVANEESYDVDLTELSSTMMYSEVYNMVASPENYLGKKIKMCGNFSIYQDQTTGKIYYACLVTDASSCCSQGIEFVLEGDHTYPDDYPEINTVITVTGIFDTYEENGYTYCQLINAKMEV